MSDTLKEIRELEKMSSDKFSDSVPGILRKLAAELIANKDEFSDKDIKKLEEIYNKIACVDKKIKNKSKKSPKKVASDVDINDFLKAYMGLSLLGKKMREI
jgi:hypothetical protein